MRESRMACRPSQELQEAWEAGFADDEIIALLCRQLRGFGAPVDRRNWPNLSRRERLARIQQALDALEGSIKARRSAPH
ncbi:hypothetical protein [Alsobacter sp. SYSU BS001988]